MERLESPYIIILFLDNVFYLFLIDLSVFSQFISFFLFAGIYISPQCALHNSFLLTHCSLLSQAMQGVFHSSISF